MINEVLSRRIYSKLSDGCVINRIDFLEGRETENPLYLELLRELTAYRQMYSAIGFELVHHEGFFFIRDADSVEPYRDATVKIVALLTVLGQVAIAQGYRYALLSTDTAGVSEEICRESGLKEEIADILSAVGLTGDLWQELNTHLLGRDIGYLNGAGRLVLADAGRYFFETLFDSEPQNSV